MEIKLENLVKTYNARRNTPEVKAVKNISLSIPSNKIFGIIGKSGAGKSTLVRLISLLETPDSGSVFYDNKRVDNISGNELIEQRRRIGMIFQNFNLFSSRTAGQVATDIKHIIFDNITKKETLIMINSILESQQIKEDLVGLL